MVDLDPEIWNNPTLGEAANNGFADEKQAQEIENEAAKREDREPMVAVRLHRYPGAEKDFQIESSYDDGMRMVDPVTFREPPEVEESRKAPATFTTATGDEKGEEKKAPAKNSPATKKQEDSK